jgi:hypothetical protein
MAQTDDEYLRKLREHASKTRQLFSNAHKPERERMVVRALLRCIGVPFADSEIQASTAEPVDTVFRTARFQVRDLLGGRRRGREAAHRQRRYEQARQTSDLLEPWHSSKPMPFGDVAAEVAEALAGKASRYGVENCATLDALVYVDLSGRHMYPLEPAPNDRVAAELNQQGWRSVSFVFLPYSVVLVAKPEAPDFLNERVGLILNLWPHPDGWFEA